MNVETAYVGVVVLLAVIMALIGLVGLVSRRTPPTDNVEVEFARCLCGEPATDAMPTLQRSRGSWDLLRSIFAAPARYKRVVDPMTSPSLCKVHAHVADAKIDEFIYTRVRGVLAEINAKIAAEAACFEKETLPKALVDGLTEKEKKTARTSASPLRALAGGGGLPS